MANIGLQLFSIRELCQKDFAGALKKVAQIGYGGVEFAGYHDTCAKELKKILDDLGLKSAGSHVPIELIRENLDRAIEYSLMIGDPYIICPGLPENMRDSVDAMKRTADYFNSVGYKCRENGLGFGYHNHADAFEKLDGEYCIDILMKNTQPDLAFLELDIFWAKYGNVDPLEVVGKYGDRCKSLHVKDMKSNDEKICTELGKGIIEVEKILQAGKMCNVEWYVVEQEEFEIPELESIEENCIYLRKFFKMD